MGRKIFILILTVFTIFSTKGQENLSLQDAIQISLKNNFQIIIANYNNDIAKRNNNWMEAGALPTISFNASQNYNWNESNNPTSFINGKFRTSSFNYSGNVNWTLFNGFRVLITKNKLETLQEQTEGNAAVVVENTIQAVILGYYNALVQQEKLKALQTQVKISTDRLNYLEEKRKLGAASSFDVLQVKNAMLTDSTNFLMQEIAFKNALRNLNLLMAIDIEKEYNLTEKLEVAKVIYEISDLKSKMLSNNQTLKNQFLNQEMMKHDRNIARSALFPVVSFNAGFNNSTTGFKYLGDPVGYFGPTETSGNQSFSYSAGLTLSFTLFNGRKAWRAFKNAGVQEAIAQTTTEEMQFKLTNDLINAYELYKARLNIVSLTKQTLESADLNLKIASEKFKTGSINSFDFRDIQTAYLNAASAHFEANYNLLNSKVELMRLTGGILEEYKLSQE